MLKALILRGQYTNLRLLGCAELGTIRYFSFKSTELRADRAQTARSKRCKRLDAQQQSEVHERYRKRFG